MGQDAIQQDVSNGGNDSGAVTDEILSPRELAMMEISGQIEEQRTDNPSPFTVGDRGKPESEPDALADTQPEQIKVKVKVDGQEVELPLSEVTKGYQKDAVASRRLAEAAEERKKLEAFKLELDERERTMAQGALSNASLDDDTDVDAQIAAAVKHMVEGDEAEASEMLKSILKKGRQSTTPVSIDEDAIIAKAEARLEEKRAVVERASAWDEFIASNPDFANETSKQRQYGDYLFDSVYAPQIQSGELSYREALQKTAQDVTDVFNPGQPTPRQQKEERKKAIDNLPVASGARSGKVQETAATTDDVLKEMMASRGQPI
jgi:hypothetical protein